MKVVIIIPTYNERENIGNLIEYLQEKIFPKITDKFKMNILVVDDSSPDKTSEEVILKQKKYKNVHLLVNPKKSGLGGAYLKGMQKAVDEMGADILFEMDADFSHDPKVIPAFLKKIEEGFDLVLGSRYIKGGAIPSDWGLHRKVLSLLGNTTIRIVITHFGIHDWTTGYRAIKTEVFQKLRSEMKKREFSGYTWQIGFLHKTIRQGFKVAEVPIVFVDRKYGKSKLGIEYIKNTLLYIFTIRLLELKQVIKFATVGTIGFIINFSALELFHKAFNISPDNAAAMGAELAIISNFTLNNIWTFKERKINSPKLLLSKFLQFNLASFGSVAIQKVGIWTGIQFFGQKWYQLYFIVSVCLGLFLNYLVYTKIIWKKEK
jgi:dolichol-phosphate mannosyltransferase